MGSEIDNTRALVAVLERISALYQGSALGPAGIIARQALAALSTPQEAAGGGEGVPVFGGPQACGKDGQPCYVGQDTDDAHWRCGTSQCGKALAPIPAKLAEVMEENARLKAEIVEAGQYTEAHERFDDLARETVAASEARVKELRLGLEDVVYGLTCLAEDFDFVLDDEPCAAELLCGNKLCEGGCFSDRVRRARSLLGKEE